MRGAFYKNSLAGFLQEDTNKIIGDLTYRSGVSGFYQQNHKQTKSWDSEIRVLKQAVSNLLNEVPTASKFGILLEYPIARRSKRIDIILLTDRITIIEFKSNKVKFDQVDEEQLLDYCLDIRDFHYLSRGKMISPVLFAENLYTGYSEKAFVVPSIDTIKIVDQVGIASLLKSLAVSCNYDNLIDYEKWNESAYAPTPTIIEAAKTLFANQSVEEISRSHAGTKNLTRTANAVIKAIAQAKANNEKIICFITGVPGAGKTLAGLKIVHHDEFQNNETSLATFLSGNGPLIKVLREALTRDAQARTTDKTIRKKEHDRIQAFIENVHRFIDEYFQHKDQVPNNKIIVFDEAQRAWNAEQSNRKFERNFSEPELMMEIMDRHQDWAVIVALVGGGQEINTGEAGLREWGNNIATKHKNWKVYVSPELKQGDHSTGNLTLFETVPDNVVIKEDADLHLDVSLRSYKAEHLSKWVQAVLDNKPNEARNICNNNLNDYKLAITREFEIAKDWLRINCLGSRRMGLVASSGGRRLRAYGLDVKAELDEKNWFLNPRNDVRSSYYLEVPATEFGIQGLELDWTCVCWDADLRRVSSNWDIKSFRGKAWTQVSIPEQRQFILNKYRVLLTRAREGMVIWIPEGDGNDHTRLPEFYDPIFEYLISCGVPEI